MALGSIIGSVAGAAGGGGAGGILEAGKGLLGKVKGGKKKKKAKEAKGAEGGGGGAQESGGPKVAETIAKVLELIKGGGIK